MNDEQLTDVQRKALLRAEVTKLQASGMDYDLAFSTAFTGHPEWHTTAPSLKRCPRRAEMTNASDDANRADQIQKLVLEYQRSHPDASYDKAFAVVLNDPRNEELVGNLPQRAFKMIQRTSGTGNTPPRTPAPKPSGRSYAAGAPPDRLKEAL